MEMKIWSDNQHREAIARWLAPCHMLSPDGLIMLQQRVEPIRDSDTLPDMIPAFLTDIKRENFGWYDGRIVCVDYAMHLDNLSTRLKKATWDKKE
jgi:hypothetical protein